MLAPRSLAIGRQLAMNLVTRLVDASQRTTDAARAGALRLALADLRQLEFHVERALHELGEPPLPHACASVTPGAGRPR
jgi:hypothetical protein